MRGALEALVFIAIALALHVLVWPRDVVETASSSGAGGEDLTSITASTAAIEQLVQEFDRPPETTEAQTAPEPPVVEPVEPVQPQEFELALQVPNAPAQVALPTPPDMAALEEPQPPEPPAPPPPPEPEPEPQVEPEPEPDTSQLAVAQSRRPAPMPDRPDPPQRTAEQPAERQQQQSASAPARQAAGSGGGAAAGQQGTAQQATLSASARNSLMAEWGGTIRAQIARRSPRGLGRNAQAVIRINVRRDGALLGVQLVRSSGNQQFDQAAVQAVRQVGRFRAAPQQLPGNTHRFDLPVRSR